MAPKKYKWYRRRRKIALFRRKHPKLTLQEIGDHFGIRRWSVYKALRKSSMPTIHAGDPSHKSCRVCGRSVVKNKMCSPECRERFYFIMIQCYVCGAQVRRLRSLQAKRIQAGMRLTFCSPECTTLNLQRQQFTKRKKRSIIKNS